MTVSNGTALVRRKRGAGAVLGLAGLGAAFVSLAWVSLQQADISRHNAKFKAMEDLSTDQRNGADVQADMVAILRKYEATSITDLKSLFREHQMQQIDHYLESLYSQWESAIAELSSGYRFDSIRSEVLKEVLGVCVLQSLHCLRRSETTRCPSSRSATGSTIGFWDT